MPVDPTTAGAAAAGLGAGAAAVKGVSSAVGRVIGPSLDKIGEFLAGYTEFRLNNVARIAEIAERKAGERVATGTVPPRVAHRLLEEGSYCDDELMAEYFGGLLGASVSVSGRDDRAAMWTAAVAAMSAVEVRAHYLLYREWAGLLRGRLDLVQSLGMDTGRRTAKLYLPVNEFSEALSHGESTAHLSHAIVHLVRLGLLDPEYGFGAKNGIGAADSRFEQTLKVHPSVAGMELYGWAQGVPGLDPQMFPLAADVFDCDPPLPRIAGAYLPVPPPKPPHQGDVTPD